MPALSQPNQIVAVRLSSMGDVIHALPAVASLKQSFPEARLTWIVRPRWAALLDDNPYVDEVIALPRLIGRSFSLASKLRARRIDLCVDFQGLMQTALLASALRPKALVGFDASCVREKQAAWFYSSKIRPQAQHAVDRNLALASAAGAKNMLRVFPLPQGSPEGSLPSGKFVLASPLAGWGSKQWPLQSWAALARMLPFPLVVNGAPDAESILRKIEGAQVHLSGISGLLDATRRAAAVIGVDSGPMHLAAALGKPGVAIFGPTDPARHGPYGGSLRVLRDLGAVTDYHRSAETAASMRAITPEMVRESLKIAMEVSA